MQNQTHNVGPRDHMEVARAAQWLWQQAGRPAGRYIEFWTKVEQALADARNAETNLAELARDLSNVEQAAQAAHDAKAGPKAIHHTEWIEATFEHPVLCKEPNHSQTAGLTARPAMSAQPANGAAPGARPVFGEKRPAR